MPDRRSSLVLGALACLVAATAPARAAVDVEVGPNVKMKGSFATADEVETLRFEAPAGATVTIGVAAKKKAPLDLELSLRGPDDAVIDVSSAPVFKDVGKKVLVKKLELARSGAYTLEVRGGAAGEYALKLTVAPRKKWSETTPSLDPGESANVAIGAPRGSRLVLKAKPDRGSDAVARWLSLGATDLSGTGKVKATSHKTGVDDSGDELDVSATVANGGTQAGSVAWTIVVKAPRSITEKLDLRGAAIGGDAGTAIARTVPAETGATVEVEDVESPLDGASIVVPPGALPSDTRISITSAPELSPPYPATQLTVGAPFVLGPEGLTFAQPVDVWVPFDPAKLPAGVDPADLKVRKVSVSGDSVELNVLEVAGDRVRVQVTSFSAFVPFTTRGTPRLQGASFWDLFVELEAYPDGVGMDSRGRGMFLGMASITFGAESTPGGFALDLEDREVQVSHDAAGNGTVQSSTSTGSESLSWSYGATGQSVVVAEGPGESTEWQMNADGTILSIDDGSNDQPLAAFDLMLRKPAQRPTAATVAGTYWFTAFGMSFEDNGTGPNGFGAFREFGEFTFRADGTFSLSGRLAEQEFDGGTGAHVKNTENDSGSGTFSVVATGPWDGAIEVTLPGDDPQNPEVLRFFPEASGRVAVGSHRDARDDGFLFIVAIRQTTGMKLADVSGPMRSIGFEFEPTVYSAAGAVPVPDFSAWSTSEDLTFSNGRILTPGIFFHGWERDPSADGGLSVTNVQETDDGPIPFNLRSTGRWSIGKSSKSEEIVGAFAPDGSFGFYSFAPDGPDDLFGIGFFFQQPPARP